MKKTFKLMAALVMGAGMMFSCQQAEDPTMDKAQEPIVKTRAYGDKTPKVTIYVETNDVNPLNAGDYMLSDGTAYADIVEFFAANLNKETVNGVVRPTLYLNDKMTNLLENGGAATYVACLLYTSDAADRPASQGHQSRAHHPAQLAEYRLHESQ